MASSLHKLLSEDIQKTSRKNPKFKTHRDSVALPIFICHDRRSSVPSKGPPVISSRKPHPDRRKNDPAAIDEVAVKALVSILSGHVGRYLNDGIFRRTLREKCSLCFEKGRAFDQFEMGIDCIDKLVDTRNMDLELLQQSIKIFKNLSSSSENPNSNSCVSACGHLYLSILYKISENEKMCAKQLLKVFVDSPFLARTHLLPELWDHVFLPHLLHIKVWREKEVLCFSEEDEGMTEALNEQYDYHMDVGTEKFALYYKEWLTFGGRAPSVPSVALPSRSSSSRSRRKSADSASASFHGTSNKSLYRTVFGPILKGRSMDMDNENGSSDSVWDLEVEEEGYDERHFNHVEKKSSSRRKSSSSLSYHRAQKVEEWPESRKSDYLRLLGCRTESSTVHVNYISNNERIKNDQNTHLPPNSNGITRAIATICSSESLSECEKAIRSVAEAWINSPSDKTIEMLLSQASAIEGIMEVLYVSTDDEILELAISLLAELAAKNEINRLMILNSDPQLDVLMKLFRSSSLFLKSAALLYLIKPKAKQMVLMEWVPLVLRVLEFGEQSQILFSVRCEPKEAAYYFFDELLSGFDEDKNLENARQIVTLGGLSLLVRRMDEGGIFEKRKACAVLHYCIKADGSCRYYVAKNLKKETIITLLALGTNADSLQHALGLLTELVCLSRRTQIIDFLNGLKKGWDCLNTMHVLLILLQRARPEEQPIIAVILLQIDLTEDTTECSVYREEAVDAIIKALDCWVFGEMTQELSARALLILGGQFSYIGEPDVERWLLRKAGHDDEMNAKSWLLGKNISIDGRLNLNEDEKTTDSWQRKIATALLTSGNKRLFSALSDSIANSLPCLARASLVTVCWMSISLHSLEDKGGLQLWACSIMTPQLIDCLNDNASIEEKILASFSLYNLTKGTDYFSRLSRPEKEVLGCLDKLSRMTWTAKELIALIGAVELPLHLHIP